VPQRKLPGLVPVRSREGEREPKRFRLVGKPVENNNGDVSCRIPRNIGDTRKSAGASLNKPFQTIKLLCWKLLKLGSPARKKSNVAEREAKIRQISVAARSPWAAAVMATVAVESKARAAQGRAATEGSAKRVQGLGRKPAGAFNMSRSALLSKLEMFGQFKSLRLIVRADVLAVEFCRPCQHFLINKTADCLSVLQNERHFARSHFQHRA
jgi:hypothetical protein